MGMIWFFWHTHTRLQHMLNFCHHFATENEFDFNSSKCKVMVFDVPTRRLKNFRFLLDDDELEFFKNYKCGWGGVFTLR